MPTLKNHLLGARLHNLTPDKKILSCLEGSNNKYLVIDCCYGKNEYLCNGISDVKYIRLTLL